jgi:1,2-diacylglycerol 3-alpha-glucosyltransferase
VTIRMTVPARIALVAACPFPSPQGSQVFVGQMARGLAARGHDVHLLTYGQGADAGIAGVRHHRARRVPGDDSRRSGPNLAKPFLDALLTAALVRVVREHRIDVIHAHNYEAAITGLVARARTGVPVVYHSHNLMGDELATYFDAAPVRRVAAIAGAALDRTVPRRADRTIALCAWSAERLVEAGCDPMRVVEIPPAVDDDGPLPVTAADRTAVGIDAGDFVVGYCGNLDRYQNIPLLLDALGKLIGPSLHGATQRIRLLIATHAEPDRGVGDLVRRAAAAGLGDALVVRVVGDYDGARRALAASDILALPRRLGSGYPVKLLNSMSAAKAVVSAGCGSKILRNGVDGVVVADDDAEALAGAIDRLRHEPAGRRALGEAARRTFLERMTWDTVLPQIEGVYAGLREPAAARCNGT